jgi:hypothetical protein
MSHFMTIQTQIRDIDALRDACTELGLELLPNAEARGFSQNRRKGEYVIRLKGPYDIALNQEFPEGGEKKGSYGLTTDWWDGHVEREVGPKYGRLLQLYGVHKTLREARRQRYRVTRKVEDDGSIALSLHRM